MTARPATTGSRPSARDLLHDVHSGDRWLAVVAHPDDEAFGCGSVLARAALLGADVTIACATRGEAGEVRPGSGTDRTGDLGAVREAELRAAAGRLGAARVELLGWRDSGFAGDPEPGTLCAAGVDEVAGVLGGLLRELLPDVVVVLDGSDGHRDHRHVGAAARTALRALPEPRPLLVEHCLPNALMRRWLTEMRALRPGTVYLQLDPAYLGRPDDEITDVLDATAVLDRRTAAISEHRSQTSPFDGLGTDLQRAFLTTDHLARVDLAGVRPDA
ncbi:PIG-L deacetylase family protein [Trujillonella humicola]|uniref:PIG-L deacetylase family protein n=1 Tax=Trujillonella humicola TaxID=3383699 RepID=UPI0039065071